MNRSAQWRTTRGRAFRRDQGRGAACWICGQPIDYTRGMSSGDDYDPEAYEPDHFLPVKDYPELENDLANLRPAHARCNRSRKDRAGIELRDNPSREW